MLNSFFNNVIVMRVIKSLISIIVSTIVYKMFVGLISSSIDRGSLGRISNRKKATYLKMLKSVFRYIIIVFNLLIILKINGVDITSMLAGVGIIGIIIGFAIQDALKDIIKGIDIITDNYYQVGDVISYNNIVGKVISVGLKTTKLEDIYTLNIVSISNRNIEQVAIVSNVINIDIPMSYDTKLDKAEKVIGDIISKIEKHDGVDNCEYRGVNEFADSSIKYQIKVYCSPTKKVQIRRDALRYILLGLEENDMLIPFNQIDVHQK